MVTPLKCLSCVHEYTSFLSRILSDLSSYHKDMELSSFDGYRIHKDSRRILIERVLCTVYHNMGEQNSTFHLKWLWDYLQELSSLLSHFTHFFTRVERLKFQLKHAYKPRYSTLNDDSSCLCGMRTDRRDCKTENYNTHEHASHEHEAHKWAASKCHIGFLWEINSFHHKHGRTTHCYSECECDSLSVLVE